MKLGIGCLVLSAIFTSACAQLDYTNYGIIAPTEGQTHGIRDPLNITFNPSRWRQEATHSISVSLISANSDAPAAKSYTRSLQLIEDMKPNVVLTWNNAETDAYQIDDIGLAVYFGQPVSPGAWKVVIEERFGSLSGYNTAYWNQDIVLE
ncbi:hypothetical protein VNI00_000527 [Paramarasmius palmivorus]|uniref:DUF3859 domain-containing protein n=1 Tax=Paramarasmius palmivorus TaxID=297713 RepID=A0AAW0E9N3_9AGAR